MNKILFSNIKTRDELITRIVDGKLSIGCYWRHLGHLFSSCQTNEKPLKVIVKYSSTYGTNTKELYI